MTRRPAPRLLVLRAGVLVAVAGFAVAAAAPGVCLAASAQGRTVAAGGPGSSGAEADGGAAGTGGVPLGRGPLDGGSDGGSPGTGPGPVDAAPGSLDAGPGDGLPHAGSGGGAGAASGDAAGAGPGDRAGAGPGDAQGNGVTPADAAESAATVRAAVAAAEAAAGESTELGVAVLDRATGELGTGARGEEAFYTASLVKVLVVVDMLERQRSGEVTVTPADLALVARALGPSDDAAMNVLWSRFDGAGALGRVAARLGLAATRAPDDPSQWGESLMSAVDAARLWAHVLDGIPAADRDLLLADLAAAPPVAADGFEQDFGLLAPELPVDAIAKQGWMCCFGSVYYLHSAGVVGEDQRHVVVLLGRVPRAGGWDGARDELDAIADAAVRVLG